MKHTAKNVPIIVPCYQRPEFFSECLSHLENCKGIENFTVVFCFDDKEESSDEVIDMCRGWSASHYILFARGDVKYGSMNSTGAIKFVLEHTKYEGGFIYIEEDIIVSENFLDYCLDSLNFYNDNPYVMNICGYKMGKGWNAQEERATIQKASVNPKMLGFASWANRWKYINNNIERYCYVDREFLREEIQNKSKIPPKNSVIQRWMKEGLPVNRAGGGLIYAASLIEGRYFIYPDRSLTSHIGWYGWHIEKNPSNQQRCVNRVENFDPTIEYNPEFPAIDKEFIAESLEIDMNIIGDPEPLA